MNKNLRKSGIEIVGNLPWGTHFCQFYDSKEDLTEILVPYFKAGLENNEFCLWITSEPLDAEDAKETLRGDVPYFDTYLENGQMEIIPYTHVDVINDVLDSKKILKAWFEKIDQILSSGYDGLRFSINAFWMGNKNWNDFMEYGIKIDKFTDKKKIIFCTYSLDICDATEIIKVASYNQFSLIKKAGEWDQINNLWWKEAKKATFRSIKEWEHTFDAIPDMIAIIDNKYRFIRVNKAMAKRLRLMSEECIGLTCYLVVHGTEEPPSFCPYCLLLKDNNEHVKKVHEEAMGGYFIVSVSPLHNSEGKLTGCIHVARDINECTQAEKALQESEERFRSAFDESAIGMTLVSRDCRLLRVNNALCRLLGFKDDELKGQEFLDFSQSDDINSSLLAHKAVVDKESSLLWIEKRYINKDGQIIWCEVSSSPVFDSPGRMLYTVAHVQDITERKKVEEALKLSNIYNRSLIEASLDPLVTIGHDGKITDVNTSTEFVTGYSRDELVGTDFTNYFTDPDKAKKGYQEVFRGGFVSDYSLEIRHKSGGTTPVLYNASFIWMNLVRFLVFLLQRVILLN